MTIRYAPHCESREELWLQGKVALQTHIFRRRPTTSDQQNFKRKLWNVPQVAEARHNNSLTTTDIVIIPLYMPCLALWGCGPETGLCTHGAVGAAADKSQGC